MKESKKVTLYSANQRFDTGLLRVYYILSRNIIGSWELIIQLFKRDFFAQYKKSFLGIIWMFITPLIGVVSWILMQFTGVLNPGDLSIPYPVYILVGTVCWRFFIDMINAGSTTLSTGSDLIQQVKYPHEALLIKQVMLLGLNFAISFVFVLITISLFGYAPSWKVVFVPLLLVPAAILGTSIGLVLSVFSIVAFDITRLFNSVMGFLIYTAPIIYSDKIDNYYLQILNRYNPLTYLICSIRDMTLYGELYEPTTYGYIVLGSLFFFFFVWRFFYLSEDKIVERMI